MMIRAGERYTYLLMLYVRCWYLRVLSNYDIVYGRVILICRMFTIKIMYFHDSKYNIRICLCYTYDVCML